MATDKKTALLQNENGPAAKLQTGPFLFQLIFYNQSSYSSYSSSISERRSL